MHAAFEPILAVARVMEGFSGAWFVSGGWAIDLAAGRVTRVHEDLEVGILRADQALLRAHLAGWELCKAVATAEGEGEWVEWEPGEWLALPVHQVRARRKERDPHEFEVFLNEGNAREWRSRRHAGLSRAMEEACLRTPLGVPVLAPEIQLLYKAKYHRPKDDHDFHTALPVMTAEQRAWLRSAVEAYHPDDPWLPCL